MAVPTITSITPSRGLTGGRLLVEIVGTNFQLPPVPALTGRVSIVPNPSVEVLFGSELGLDVAVLSPTLLHVTSPIADPGVVSVTVRNIDQDGDLVPGETVTSAAAFTYARPELNTTPLGGGGTTVESDLARLVRSLLREIKRQVHPNVELTVHTDYADSPSGANVAMLSSLPGLVLAGPGLRENRFFSENAARSVALSGSRFRQQRPAYTVDLVFTLVGVDDSALRLLNLMKETTLFFHRNKTLRMLADPTVAGTYVEYEMEIETNGDFNLTPPAGVANSNVRSFSGTFAIFGLDLDDADMSVLQTKTVVDVLAGVQAPNPVLLGGIVSDGSGLPLEADGSAPPAAGEAYIPQQPGTGFIEQIPPDDEE